MSEPAAAQGPAIPAYIEPKADLIYGATDSGKTTNIGYASDYVLAKYGQLSRIATADGGGIGPLSGLAKSGQLEVWSLAAWREQLGTSSKPIVIAAMQKAVKGYWPAKLDDPESPMLAPDAGTYEIYGLMAYEGLTSWGDQVLMNLKSERASLSQDPSYTFVQGGESFSGGNKSYYGFIQDQLYAWVALSHLLPFKKIVWTALESRGDDSEGTPVYGPAIAGRKALSKAPNWFANCLHIDIVDKPSSTVEVAGTKLTVSETERIMWLCTHADPSTRVNFPAKVRIPVEYKSERPAHLVPPNLAKVYELIDKLEARQMESSSSRMNEVEAVRERLLKAAAGARERQEKLAMEKAKRAMVTVPGVPASMPAAGPMVVPIPPGRPAIMLVATAPVPAAPVPLSPVPVPSVPEPGHAPVIQTIKRETKDAK